MSWINIYLILNFIVILFLTALLGSKKYRISSIIYLFGLFVLYSGLFIIDKNYYPSNKSNYLEFKYSNAETGQLSSSTWLDILEYEKYSLTEDDLERLNIYYPLGGAPNLNTFYCMEDENRITFISDRFGFRNNDSLWDEKNHDLLIIGDSFAQGACVQKTLADYLNSKNLISVSLGISGNGPLASHAVLREYKNRFKSKYIVNIIFGNDFSRSINGSDKIDFEEEINNIMLLRYLKDSKFFQDYFRPNYLSKYQEFSSEMSERLMYENINNRGFKDLTYNLSNILGYRVIKQTLINISLIRNNLFASNKIYLKDNDIDLLVDVYLKNQVIADQSQSTLINVVIPPKSCLYGDASNEWIESIFKENLNSTFYDLTERICNKDFFAVKGNHFNKDGYRALAQEIINIIE